jgi:hypothetical protein
MSDTPMSEGELILHRLAIVRRLTQWAAEGRLISQLAAARCVLEPSMGTDAVTDAGNYPKNAAAEGRETEGKLYGSSQSNSTVQD